MASHHSLLRHTATAAESPAKVFAKLKSKVQREAMFAKQGRLTDNNTLRHAREIHGADFYASGRGTESTWMMDDKENRGLGFCSDEAEALTLSPIPTPQKSLGCSYMDLSIISPRKVPNATGMRNEFTPTKRAVLESAAASQPLVRQIHRAPPAIRDSGVFMVLNGTPSNGTPSKPREDVRGRSVSDDPPLSLDKLMSPAKMFSSMKERLRKRKWEQEAHTHATKEPGCETTRQPKERKLVTTFNGDHDATVGDLVQVRGTPVHAEMNPDTQEPIFTPRTPISKTRRSITLMSPAKMFTHIKERESGRQQQESQKVSSSVRELTNAGQRRQFPDNPASTACDEETEDRGPGSPAESETPGSRSTAEAADSQSDDSPAADVPVPSVSSQPALLEDPLVLNSPQISIPKKREAVSRSNKWPMPAVFPSESMIYLKSWYLERNRKGLYVDGILRDDGVPWHSNIIVERVSNSVLKTVSGRLYVLVGKMNTAVQSEFPKWFLRKFVHGFPPNWKILYETFVSESRNKETGRNIERRHVRSRTVSETPDTTLSTKQRRQKPLKIPASCPPPSFSSSSAKVSRSGRVIKPPLEYWKGGRVILDADMNVTIHECYDTSICKPAVTTTVSTRVSNTPSRVFMPRSEDHDEPSAPLRKVKAPQRKHNQTKSFRDRKPSSPNEHPKVVLAYHIGSPEEQCSRLTRSSQRRVVTERNSCSDGVPQTQSRPELRSRKQTHDANRSSARIAEKKKAVSSAADSPTASKETPQSDLNSSIQRRKKGAHRKNGKNETQPSHKSPPKQPSKSREDVGRRQRSRAAAPQRNNAAQTKHQPSKCTKMSPPPPEPHAKPTQTGRKRKGDKSRSKVIQQEGDEDEWTEAERRKLQEAVTSYPKHMTDYWANVAMVVGTRSAEECHRQHTSQGAPQTPSKRETKPKKVAATTKAPDHPVISARVGTLKRKQQVRQFLEAMPKDDVDDVFSSAYMQSKRFELPSICPSDDQDFALSDQEPVTPSSAGFPEAKTPQCLHITPGMMGSPSRTNDDKYIYQLQKRMKKSQFNVCKQGPPLKSFTPTPSVKRALRRCGNTENDTFVVWEMFPEKAGALSDSGEEEDFYFSDND